MKNHCKANPCCGDPYACEVPLPQHRSGLWFHNSEEYRRKADQEIARAVRHDHWRVVVETSGEHIISIEPEMLCGREISEADEDAIRTAAHHLLAFIGDPAPQANVEVPDAGLKPIPIEAAKHVAKEYGYDQVLIYARRCHDTPEPHGEHMTTYGRTREHCDVAARIGDTLKKFMGWEV